MNAIEEVKKDLKELIADCEETARYTAHLRNGESRAWRAVARRIRWTLKKMKQE